MKYLIKQPEKLKQEWKEGEIVEIAHGPDNSTVEHCLNEGWLEPYDGPEPYKHVVVMVNPAVLTDNAPQPNG